MKIRFSAIAVALSTAALPAQDFRPAPAGRPAIAFDPARLPADLLNPSPKEPEKDFVEGQLISFDPNRVAVDFDDFRYVVRSGNVVIRDYGTDRARAEAMANAVRENGFTHRGEVPGGNPPFEYWLVESSLPRAWSEPVKTKLSAAERKMVSNLAVIPMDARSVKVEKNTGAWCVRDSGRVLYNFAQDEAAAKRAAAVLKHYEFNAVGMVGNPRQPFMTFPIRIPSIELPGLTAASARSNPGGGLQFLADGLFIPDTGYVAHRRPLDVKKMDLTRGRECSVVAGAETLGNFGTDELGARQMLAAFQGWRATDYVEVGQPPVRFYLSNGQVPRGIPFGARATAFRTEDLKVVKVKETHRLQAGSTVLLECGANAKDAELVLKVAKYFGVDSLVKFGTPRYGEYAVLVKGR